MKIKVYHGTSKENADAILKNGFNSENLLWNCSWDMKTYLWNSTKIEDYEEIEENEMVARERASDSAKISASVMDSKTDYVCIFEIEIDDSEVEDDDSCENMAECSQIDSEILNNLIKNGDAKILNVYKYRYYPSLRLFYLPNIATMEYSNVNWYLTDTESKALNIIIRSDSCLYEIFEPEEY